MYACSLRIKSPSVYTNHCRSVCHVMNVLFTEILSEISNLAYYKNRVIMDDSSG